MPRVLFLGDIVGRPGRTFVASRVASLKSELRADFVIANAENSAGGAGITGKIANQLKDNVDSNNSPKVNEITKHLQECFDHVAADSKHKREEREFFIGW